MPRTRVIRDLDHPDFPHGTDKGYGRGCRRPCCIRGHSLSTKTVRWRRARGIVAATDLVPAAPVRAHVETLLAATRDKGATLQTIARAAGVQPDTPQRLLTDDIVTCRAVHARAILAVTVEDMHRHCAYVERAPYVLMHWQLRALGYNSHWQAGMLGAHGSNGVQWVKGGSPLMLRSTAEKMEALWRAYSNTWATTEATGSSPHMIERCKRAAAKAGYYPPACYDDDGKYIAGSLRRNNPDRDVEDRARRRIAALALVAAGQSTGEAAAAEGIEERNLLTAKSEIGLTMMRNPQWRARDPEYLRTLVGAYVWSPVALRVMPLVRAAHHDVQIGQDAVEVWRRLVVDAHAVKAWQERLDDAADGGDTERESAIA